MLGSDVFPVLHSKNIFGLFHANSVVTSNSLLQLRGLASRGCVESHSLPQSAQYTDAADRHFGIWNDVFTDGVDIHARSSNRNQYGPVLFVLDAKILLELPEGCEVLVTRTNPTKWMNGQPVQDRYFTTVAELMAGLTYGTFDQMITFRTVDGFLPFGERLEQIILDDPQARRVDGSDVFTTALQSLRATAAASGIAVPIVQRACNGGCKCIGRYAADGTSMPKFF